MEKETKEHLHDEIAERLKLATEDENWAYILLTTTDDGKRYNLNANSSGNTVLLILSISEFIKACITKFDAEDKKILKRAVRKALRG